MTVFTTNNANDLVLRSREATWQPGELAAGITRVIVGIAIIALVHRVVRRVPWPRPFRLWFPLFHLATGLSMAGLWYLVATFLEDLIAPGVSDLTASARFQQFLFIGTIFYFIFAVFAYAAENSARAARAESVAAQTQLAALRAQLHPHFLFNSLHTVVQLIPVDPRRAAEAAEMVGDLLRSTLEEQRDEVTLAEEWRFVSRYLELERIRFGERLSVQASIPDELMSARVPSFSMQTLVENAIHHGAAKRVAPTEIRITASRNGTGMKLSVHNPSGSNGREARPGTGLARLRERLNALYGSAAKLDAAATADGEFASAMTVPFRSFES